MRSIQDYLNYFQLPSLTPALMDVLLLLGALLILGLLLFTFVRKAGDTPIASRQKDSRSRKSSGSSSSSSSSSSSRPEKELIQVEEKDDGRVRRKFRRRRRSHRPRNPSLSDTGGLPPVKNDSDNDS